MARTERRRRQAAAPREGGQARRGRENLPRPQAAAAAPPAAPTVARPQAPGRRGSRFGFLRRLVPRGAVDILSELRKVTWPTLADTRYLTIVVAIVALIVGLFLGVMDLIFGYTIEQLFF